MVKEPEQAISRFLELYVFIYLTHNLTNIDFHSRIYKPPLPGCKAETPGALEIQNVNLINLFIYQNTQ